MSDQSAPVVEVSSGKLRGTIIENVGRVQGGAVCRAPSTGAHRFLPPPRAPEPMGGHP